MSHKGVKQRNVEVQVTPIVLTHACVCETQKGNKFRYRENLLTKLFCSLITTCMVTQSLLDRQLRRNKRKGFLTLQVKQQKKDQSLQSVTPSVDI